MAYLYAFAGQPWKTQAMVRRLVDTMYTDRPDGLIGNEDCGQMSAWYVLSALGFYAVAPGSGQYVIGTPLFPKATIRLENGRRFVVRAPNVSPRRLLRARRPPERQAASAGVSRPRGDRQREASSSSTWARSRIRTGARARETCRGRRSRKRSSCPCLSSRRETPSSRRDPRRARPTRSRTSRSVSRLDGSAPTAASPGTSGPIAITGDTALRAVALNGRRLSSPVAHRPLPRAAGRPARHV